MRAWFDWAVLGIKVNVLGKFDSFYNCLQLYMMGFWPLVNLMGFTTYLDRVVVHCIRVEALLSIDISKTPV